MKKRILLQGIYFLLAIIISIPSFSQKNKLSPDSLAIRDSIKNFMFQGALLSMDALQAKYESEKKLTVLAEKQQKAGESQNLFYQSRTNYRKAIALDQNYYPAWTSMGTTYFMQDIPKAAIPCYRKALSLNENFSPAWYNLGKAYEKIDMRDSAIYAYNECIHTDSTAVKAYQELSRITMSTKKDSAAALKLLRLAAHYQPSSEVPYDAMATIYFSFKDSTNAISALESAAKIYSGDIERLQLLVNYFQRHTDKKKADYYSNLLAIEKKKLEIEDENPDK